MYPKSLLVEPLKIEDGYMVFPNKPGIGVDVNWDVIEEYRVNK